ncbi:hypothetical protein BEH_07780 [Priestia filamentosa]|uniref:Uncharacterized protein n=1 Tax=Priestia filamentosa TaxID=1402861 RepID=A0A0H4KI89_9BACI|nr:hypothetical protein [Priestia filamentosa]AKO92009.1 hypothetical protein BEH_07780 [Priestia filamentosa]
MEKIQSHEIKDIWRVQDGLLVEIYKYDSLGYHIHSDKIKAKIIRGCKGLKELKEDYTDSWEKKTYPKGTLLYHGQPVRAISDRNKFKAEIKSSGGSVLGSITEINKVLEDIEHILNQY